MLRSKKSIQAALIAQLQADMQGILSSAQNAHEGATHSDAQAKSKYDTHGLELSYLAGSQYRRARALELQIQGLEREDLPLFAADDAIENGALLMLENDRGQRISFLISQLGAGSTVQLDGESIQVISPESVLGEKFSGLSSGDSIELSTHNKRERWTIVALG